MEGLKLKDLSEVGKRVTRISGVLLAAVFLSAMISKSRPMGVG